MFAFYSPLVNLTGELLDEGRVEPDFARWHHPPKTRRTILEGVAARSIWRMTLRYSFVHGARNLESKGTTWMSGNNR